jgi:hypothetical protein
LSALAGEPAPYGAVEWKVVEAGGDEAGWVAGAASVGCQVYAESLIVSEGPCCVSQLWSESFQVTSPEAGPGIDNRELEVGQPVD